MEVGSLRGELPAVGRGQRAMVHQRPRARPPRGAGHGLVALGGMITAELEGIAPLDQAEPRSQQIGGADLGAVLPEPGAALCLLVGAELARDPVELAMTPGDEEMRGSLALRPRRRYRLTFPRNLTRPAQPCFVSS